MRIQIQVTPWAKHASIEVISSKKLKIRLSSIPEHGKANEELIRVLSRHFKIPQARISIISGKSSRTKLVDIAFREH